MKKTTLLFAGLVLAFAAQAEIPLPEHPRPDWERTEWMNLNGSWNFGFAADRLDRKILVPFGWGSPLSGVKDDGDTGYYSRGVKVPAEWKGKRVFVVVGAADHDTTCTFAGETLGKHVGGYTPFEYELTDLVRWGEEQTLEFKVWDPSPKEAHAGHYLYGKQGYGNARGIWQTVYLEARGDVYLERTTFLPNIARKQVLLNAFLAAPAKADMTLKVTLAGRDTDVPVVRGQQVVSQVFELANPRLWSLDDPFLYDVTLTLVPSQAIKQSNNQTIKQFDTVRTYFGFREIGTGKNPNGDNYVTLNGKPVYLQLTLDQSYHPDGWYTFPSDAFMKNEILLSKKLALSGNRVHIKVEIPRKLYWADKLGLLIQADVPCAWGDASEAMFEEHWKCFEGMLARDFNHPCIYQWTLFNETWGLFSNRSLEMGLASGRGGKKRVYRASTQRKVAEAYLKAKFADPTRLVEDNSPCNRDHVVTDVYTWHAYAPGIRWEELVSGHCKNAFAGSTADFTSGFAQRGDEPMMNSECGNVWGYRGSTGDCDLTWDYHMMMNAFRRNLKCGGWLYTEHHDVCNEWNGYVRFDRTVKEFGLEDLYPGLTLADFHADAFIPLDRELCRTFKPGETYAVPVDISLVTDRYAGQALSLATRLRWTDGIGTLHETDVTGTGLAPATIGPAASWQNGHLADIAVKLPAETAVGTVNVRLMADGRTIAKNFTCFRVKAGDETDARPVRADWSEGTTNVLGGLKFNGFGKGAFEYVFDAPEGGTFYAEVSTKRKNAKDCPDTAGKGGIDFMLGGGAHDRGKNPNSYPQTSAADKFAGAVRVVANGTLVATVPLPDDPADHRGILSWASQLRDGFLREAGSYGYLVKAAIPKSLVKDGKVTVRLEGDRGLAVYGKDFGRYPFGPQVRR